MLMITMETESIVKMMRETHHIGSLSIAHSDCVISAAAHDDRDLKVHLIHDDDDVAAELRKKETFWNSFAAGHAKFRNTTHTRTAKRIRSQYNDVGA